MTRRSIGGIIWGHYALLGLGVALLVGGCGPSLAIHKAVGKGETEDALALIAEGRGVQDVDPEGRTALHCAARYGNPEVTKALLDAGLDMEQTCAKGGYKPLYLAAVNDRVAVARVLIERGANVESENAQGATALMIAAQNGHTDMMDLLIRSGADVNKQASNGASPLLVAVREGQVSAVKLLASKGANLNIRTERGEIAVVEAAHFKHTEILLFLLENGADAKASMDDGFTPLMAAARAGDLEAVKALVAKGCDLEARYPATSVSPLHYAAYNDYEDVVEYLISIGARFYSIDDGSGTYSTAVCAKYYGQYHETAGFLDQAVTHYGMAGQYYDKAIGYFESQVAETKKRIDDVQLGNFKRQLGASLIAGLAASGGGYGTASYRVYDTSGLEQRKKAFADKAAQCRQLADACRKLTECYQQHTSPREREECARMPKDQLGLR